MDKRLSKAVSRWALGLLLLSGQSACIHMEERDPRFHIEMQSHLHEGMNDMAQEVAFLTELSVSGLEKEGKTTEPHGKGEVLDSLDRIKLIAEGIGGAGVVTNYSVINRYMGAFLYDVNIAREFAERTPPNYFPAYSLIKSCLSCHDSL